MKTAKRIVYLAYYLWKMDWPTLIRFMRFTKQELHFGYTSQALKITIDSVRHNVSPLEYYQFDFPLASEEKKREWAGTGTMYEFQLQANPSPFRELLNDKRAFYEEYKEFFRHEVHSRDQIHEDNRVSERLITENKSLVFKSARGQCGLGILNKPTSDLDPQSLAAWMASEGYDLLETLIEQHAELSRLSSAGVNTVRVFTLITRDGNYRILGCRLRISITTFVDNMAAGNLAAPIDEQTGLVNGPGVYSDITLNPEKTHPVTGVAIEGFQVPFWEEILEMVQKASYLHPQNRSVGWDVAITPDGPSLIEGNHDWCKLVWQLPVRRGLKRMIMDGDRYA